VRNLAQSFEGFSAAFLWGFSLTGTSEPTEIFGAKVSTNFFSLLGVTPQLGRLFLPEEDQQGRSHVAVISDGLWRRRFGGARAAVGKTIRLDDDLCTIIGVLRPDFRQSELSPEYNSEVWTPLALDPGANNRGNHYLRAFGRLKPGAGLEQAQTELAVISRQLEMSYPKTHSGRGPPATPL